MSSLDATSPVRAQAASSVPHFTPPLDAQLTQLRAVDLEGREPPGEVVHEILCGTISVIERHESEIRGIAEVLARKKRIVRGDRSTRIIPMHLPQGPIDTGPISERGQALFDKIMGSYEHLVFFIESVATDEELAR